jgi:hypothetical protein
VQILNEETIEGIPYVFAVVALCLVMSALVRTPSQMNAITPINRFYW